jgi:hypothetical protein
MVFDDAKNGKLRKFSTAEGPRRMPENQEVLYGNAILPLREMRTDRGRR